MERKRRIRDGFLEVGIWLLLFVLLLPAALVGYAIGNDDEEAARTVTVGEDGKPIVKPAAIAAAPAFSADDLAEPTDNWITNGGSLANQRYSPLNEIDSSTSPELNGVWHTHLRAPAWPQSTRPSPSRLCTRATIYVPTGEDDVFAVDAETGRSCGSTRQISTRRSAPSAAAGSARRRARRRQGVHRPARRQARRARPEDRRGRVEDAGLPWQEGTRSRRAALRRRHGHHRHLRRRVRHSRPGHGLRRQDRQGGLALLHDPRPRRDRPRDVARDRRRLEARRRARLADASVDPKLGLLYFSTGNAGPDNDGSGRAGDNLFAASIVALDVKTGKFRWHYQMVHHDIWDYDARVPPSSSTTIGGRWCTGSRGVEDRLALPPRPENGKPLLPIPEKAVPQNANQKTADPAQPELSALRPARPSDQQYSQALKQVAETAGDSARCQVHGRRRCTRLLEDAGRRSRQARRAARTGSPRATTRRRRCSTSAPRAAPVAPPPKPKSSGQARRARLDKLGSTLTLGRRLRLNTGYFSAIDARTGKDRLAEALARVVLRRLDDDRRQSRLRRTSNGNLLAYDARSGKQLWSSRRAPVPTTRRRSSSRTAINTSSSMPAATRSRPRPTATTSGSSASTARSARLLRPVPARAPAMQARRRPRAPGRPRPPPARVPRPARPSFPRTVRRVTASRERAETAAPT